MKNYFENIKKILSLYEGSDTSEEQIFIKKIEKQILDGGVPYSKEEYESGRMICIKINFIKEN